MKNIFAFFTFALLLAGCSYSTRFAVTNRSEETVNISYSIKHVTYSETRKIFCPAREITTPEVTLDSLWYFNTGDWQEMPKERYKLNEKECSIELSLKPGESASINRTLGYPGHNHKSAKEYFEVSTLTIRSGEGFITLEGWELQKRFEEIRLNLYVYSHE